MQPFLAAFMQGLCNLASRLNARVSPPMTRQYLQESSDYVPRFLELNLISFHRSIVARMRVVEIVIDGFKSYAVRTVISGWDESFNSITGLNGSGKSNILDAICFVLGITSMSTVRAQNIQVWLLPKMPMEIQ